MRGRFIVFEGGEGGGKTTQLRHLYEWLNDHALIQQLRACHVISEIVMTREPGGTALGQTIRRLLLDHDPATPDDCLSSRAELLLYAADRAQHVEQFLNPALEKGAIVLCDRYTDSTVAYQGYGRNLNLDLIDQLNQIATGGLVSDLTLWLDLDVTLGLTRTQKRGQADRMEKNDVLFHQRVQEGFRALEQRRSDRMVRIDAAQSEAQVATAIRQVVEQKLAEWYVDAL